MKVDYIIKNGRVVDPAAGIDEVRDVAVVGSRIVALEGEAEPRWAVIDATDCIVTPGLIDFHTHLFHQGSGICIRPDFMLPYGTTAAVDAGSAGCANMRAFFSSAVEPSAVKIKAYMTVFSGGQIDAGINEDFNPAKFNEALIRRVLEKYPHSILGLKIRISKGVVEDAEPLRATVALADKIGGGLGVCVHTTNCPVTSGELADMLRPGDVFCHCFQGKGDTILDAGGRVKPAVWEAKRRGVLFDACNGTNNYCHDVARAALAEGFLPDFISTDGSHVFHSFYKPKCFALPYILSKYIALGMSVEDVLERATARVAKFAGWDRKGVLEPGYDADIAVLSVEKQDVAFEDFKGDAIPGQMLLLPQLTMKAGTIVYRNLAFT